MNILKIDNDHLPNLVGESIHSVTLRKPDDNRDSFDTWVSHELSKIFASAKYDMIVLPYSLSSRNYIDYSGLRVAMHIRLTEAWEHTRKPILFIGNETPDFVAKLSPEGDILFTPYVFTTRNHLENLDKWENYVHNKFSKDMSDEQYAQFVEKVHVLPPANYGSRHSVANLWALARLNEMLGLDSDDISSDFKSLLFYKYIRTRLGKEQGFSKSWKKENKDIARIGNVRKDEHYKIAYIDDEYSKGWETILKYVCKENHFQEPSVFKGFESNMSKADLIKSIKNFIDINDADCYLVDLRLHEDDFKGDIRNEDISGHEIARYIHSKNRANQIVIFTASNKVWNLKEDLMEIGAAGYVIKESPEMKYNRSQTLKNFQDFQLEILKACRQSFIKRYVDFLKGKGYETLDSFVDLLLLDKSEEKEKVKSSLLLQLMVFLESYVDSNFNFGTGGKLFRKGKEHPLEITDIGCVEGNNKGKRVFKTRIRIARQIDKDGYNNLFKASFSSKIVELDNTFQEYACPKDKDGNTYSLTLILAVLKYYYHFPDADINLVLRSKNQRNKHVAHHGTQIEMNLNEIKYLFESVIEEILKKDSIGEQ